MTNADYRPLVGRLSEDEHYDLVREFLTEERSVPVAYIVDKGGQDVFVDPNTGDIISGDSGEWDQTDYDRFFRQRGINHIVVRDPVGSIQTGEYSKQAFLRKMGIPKRGKTFPVVQGHKIVQGQKVEQGPRMEGQRLQDALLDSEWPGVK